MRSLASFESINKTTYMQEAFLELIKSFNEAFKLPPDIKPIEIWIPNYSFLRKNNNANTRPPLGKNALYRPLLFSMNSMLMMKHNFWDFDLETYYFTPEQKKRFKVHLTDEAFILKRTVDTDKLPENSYLYILSMHGGLIAASDEELFAISEDYTLHHSSFRAGQPVLAAGNINVDAFGVIEEIDGDSGHYLTPDKNLLECALYLYDKNYINNECAIKFHKQFLYTDDRNATIELERSITIHELLTDKLQFADIEIQTIINAAKEKFNDRKRLKLN